MIPLTMDQNQAVFSKLCCSGEPHISAVSRKDALTGCVVTSSDLLLSGLVPHLQMSI